MNAERLTNGCKELVARVSDLAKRFGADASEVIARDAMELTARVRLGEAEYVEEAGSRGLGLRVFVEERCATTSTSDMRPEALEEWVRESVALARLAEPDPLHRLPDKSWLAAHAEELDLFDPNAASVDAATALSWAKRGEAAAQAFDPRISNSDGATFSRTEGATAFANSDGCLLGYAGTYSSFSVQPIADDDAGKKRNGVYWTARRHLADLEDIEVVGRKAAQKTVEQLGSKKIKTAELPVVFDPDAGRAIVGLLFSVANGSAFYRQSSYLIGREDTQIASELLTVVDDPLIVRGPGSRSYDGDGLPTRQNVLVENGIFRTILCDVYTARKLDRKPTGSAGRGTSGGPGPTSSNLILRPGTLSREDVLRGTTGLYVTSMMGFGWNPVTGDFSRGAAGFWLENGELTFPVSEVTISANFDDLLKRIDRVGSDLDSRASTQCPTFRVSSMTVAGT